MGAFEQTRLVELRPLTRASGVAPANSEDWNRNPAYHRVRAGGQEGVGEKRRVALRRGWRIEQGRALAERGKRHTEATELGRTVDPLMPADGRLLNPGRNRPAGLKDLDSHNLDPAHDCRVPLEWALRLPPEHRKPHREFRRPCQAERAKAPLFGFLVRLKNHDHAALRFTHPKHEPLRHHTTTIRDLQRVTVANGSTQDPGIGERPPA